MTEASTNRPTWRQQNPRLTLAALIALSLFLCLAGYQYLRYRAGRSHLQNAQAAVERHAWDDAQEHLKESLREWSRNPSAHLLAARVARRTEDLIGAERHLENAQRLLGEQSLPLKVEQALLQVSRGDLASGEAFLRERVAEDDQDTIEILDILSAAYILHYRVAEARYALDDLLRRQPEHFPALVRRAWTARSAGADFFTEAIEFFERALAVRPEVDTVRLALAELLVSVGRHAEGQRHFEELHQRLPNHPSVLFGLARCLANRGENDEAGRLFDRVLVMDPNDWKALGERGWLRLQTKRPGDAEVDLRQATTLAPFDLPSWTRFAQCLNLLGKHDEAKQVQARADQLRADFAQTSRLGTVIREQRPNDPGPRHELASILLRLGKTEDSLHWFHSALEKEANHRPSHESLVELYEKLGDFRQAAHHREALRRLDSAR